MVVVVAQQAGKMAATELLRGIDILTERPREGGGEAFGLDLLSDLSSLY